MQKNKDIIGRVIIRIMKKVRHYGDSWSLRRQTRKTSDPLRSAGRDKRRLSEPESPTHKAPTIGLTQQQNDKTGGFQLLEARGEGV